MTGREWIDVLLARVRLMWGDAAWKDAELVAPDMANVSLDVALRVLARFENNGGQWPPSLAAYSAAVHAEPSDAPAVAPAPPVVMDSDEKARKVFATMDDLGEFGARYLAWREAK